MEHKHTIDNRYYGVAWNYEDNSYVLTGTLLHATPETIDGLMFVHNAIETDTTKINDKCYIVPKIYQRNTIVGTAFLLEISLSPLHGFTLCKESDIVNILYTMEYAIWTILNRPTTMKYNEFGEHDDSIQQPLKQIMYGVYALPSVDDDSKIIGYYVNPRIWGDINQTSK